MSDLTAAAATITRYKLLNRTGKFPFYYGYDVQLRGELHRFGRFPLASVRRWCRDHGAQQIVETWKA